MAALTDRASASSGSNGAAGGPGGNGASDPSTGPGAFGAAPGSAEGDGPGILVLDSRGRIQTWNRAAVHCLEDLADEGRGGDALPYAVGSAVSRMGHRIARGAADPSEPLDGRIRARGRSGRWYAIQASLSEPDAQGACSTIVLIEPARPAEIVPILTRLYGLTPREREVLALAAKGRSTKRIARELGISSYTVQEHVGNACRKVGVRTRRELLAKLFFDGSASGLGH